MPIPDATRPVPAGVEWMTWPGTQREGDPLAPLPWSQFDYAKEEGIGVVLDFSRRGGLDELCWTGAERLPRIATVHPPRGELDHLITRPGHFFDVRPAAPRPRWLLDRLAAAADAEIGVLSELAGSAHLRERSGGAELRVNQSHVYRRRARGHLPQAPPFKTKVLGEETYAEPLYEDLTAEPKAITVLAATHTRLAVVICADLIDAKIPRRLAAGVNLLLAPAMTPKAGSFETTIEEVSGRCQGVSAIANVRERDDGQPFLCRPGPLPRAPAGDASKDTPAGPPRPAPAGRC
ncbi:MAG: hypothetical protein JSS68_03685 [Actinobacteria bacterium]|nr:hypothetical protein [Actinomycetota bacterium]